MPKGVWDRSKSKEQREKEKLEAKGQEPAPKSMKAKPGPKPGYKKAARAEVKKAGRVVVKNATLVNAQGYSDTKDRVILMADILTVAVQAKANGAGCSDLQQVIDGATRRLSQELDNVIPIQLEDAELGKIADEIADDIEKKYEKKEAAAPQGQAPAPFATQQMPVAPFNPPAPTT
jgi:hypothetical protein